jgi:hypothetical protein
MKRWFPVLALALASCDEAGAGPALSQDGCEKAKRVVSVKVGATVTHRGVVGGVSAGCDDPRVRAILPTFVRAIERVPAGLLRHPVELFLDPRVVDGPPVREIETHASGGLLAASGSRALSDESIVLHELFHVAVSRERPSDARRARIFEALEEGLADYFAASVTGRSEVGSTDGRETRRLTPRRSATELEWVTTATGQIGPHALGHALASELWHAWGADPRRAARLAECLRAPANVGKDVPELVRACSAHDPAMQRPFGCWALVEADCPSASHVLASVP